MNLRKVLLFAAAGMLVFNMSACSTKDTSNKGNIEVKQEAKVNNENSKENNQGENSNKDNSKEGHKESKEVNSITMLSQEEMKEDLDSLVKTLKDVHPKTVDGFSEEQKDIIDKAYEKIKEPMKMEEFYFVANEIVCSFKDAHTNINMNVHGKDKIIDVYLVWLNDGLYVNESIGELQKGDKILTLGGKIPAELLKELAVITPAENDYWIKVKVCYQLIRESYLKHFNMIEDEHVNIKVQRKNEEVEVSVPLVTLNDSKTAVLLYGNKDEKWVSYTIDNDNSLGIFKLDTCNYNSEYVDELKKFFQEVSENNIENIVVDLRENTGGYSKVVNEFIKYLNVDKYLSYGGEIRCSSQAKKQRNLGKLTGYSSFENDEINNEKIPHPELIFKGNVYALTSPLTFSSANMFAVILKDNNIGKIIGEPTGNQPSSYGDVLFFKLLNSQIEYQVSFKKWIRPNTANDPENCLTPDIIVYTTIGDILSGRDPQMEKLKEVIKK